MHQPTALRGPPKTTRKETRTAEDNQALGGMRSPHLSAERLPQAPAAGRAVLNAITAAIVQDPSLLAPCSLLASGQPTKGHTNHQVASFQSSLRSAFGLPPVTTRQGLQPDIIEAFIKLSGDPDDCLVTWLRSGAPLGITTLVTPRGVFPPDLTAVPPWSPGLLASDPSGWENYRSAELDPAAAMGVLDNMMANG